jgi:hypothetical protein
MADAFITPDQKKTAIRAVMEFNDAEGLNYSKARLFKHFGVPNTTGNRWFPANGKPEAGVKRERAEIDDDNDVDETSPKKRATKTATPRKRKNNASNGETTHDKKKLKSLTDEPLAVAGSKSRLSSPSASPSPLSPSFQLQQERKPSQVQEYLQNLRDSINSV